MSGDSLNEDHFNTSKKRQTTALDNYHWARFLLSDCITNIYIIKGREERLCVVADKGGVPRLKECVDQALLQIIPPKPPIERVRRQLFREVRNNRKSKTPQKRDCLKNSLNFFFKARSRSITLKVRRGYLNVARANVMRTLRTDEISSLVKAQEQLNDKRRFRYYLQAQSEMYSVEGRYDYLSV